MRKNTEGQIRIASSRTGSAKKFDEWPVRLPGGDDARFLVEYQAHENGLLFTATSQHPWFKDVIMGSGDPNRLKADIEALVRDRIERDREGEWAAGTKVSIRTERRRDTDYLRGSLEFRIDIEEVEFMPGALVGNRGQTPIRSEFRQEVIFQRGPEDVFTNALDDYRKQGLSGSILDPESAKYWNDPIRNECEKPMTRVIAPGDGAEVGVLVDTVERFLRAFGARMAPGRRAIEGTPAPEELVQLMKDSMPE
ncbi:hypothetical protein [Paracoccus sp. ME4]|uniref:hypothetical protein n=1 Tax=Paracoccus sp. ME4 TaxID=3138066 RepID=UPI00398B699C